MRATFLRHIAECKNSTNIPRLQNPFSFTGSATELKSEDHGFDFKEQFHLDVSQNVIMYANPELIEPQVNKDKIRTKA